MKLTDEQRLLVEENMGLVKTVISQHVHAPNGLGVYDYDDLFQIGCIGLCKAAVSFKPQGKPFSIYACVVIRNEIFGVLTLSSRKRAKELPLSFIEDTPGESDALPKEVDVCIALDSVKQRMGGVCAKGLEALQLKAQGYSSAEIGEMYGVSANNVTAWIARARSRLKQDAAFMDSLTLGA